MPNRRLLALRRREREFESRRGRQTKRRADQGERSCGPHPSEGFIQCQAAQRPQEPQIRLISGPEPEPTRVGRHLRARTSADGCSGDTSASADDLAASIASATTSSRSGNRCLYWSSVITADLWPIICCTTFDIRTGCDRQRGGRVHLTIPWLHQHLVSSAGSHDRRPGRRGADQSESNPTGVGTVLRVIVDPRPCGPRAVSRAGWCQAFSRPPLRHVIRPRRLRPPSAAGRPAGT